MATTITPQEFHNYDKDTGIGDPSTPLSAEFMNAWAIKMAADVTAGLAEQAAADSVTYAAKAHARVNVKDFGAKGDGVTGDTAAIQAAIDYAQSLVANVTRFEAGAVVYFPRGTYLIGTTLIVNTSCITLEGESASSSVIYAPDAAFNLVKFDGATLSLYNCGIKNLRFSTPGNATAGFHLIVSRCIYFVADHLLFNGWFGGMSIDSCSKTYNSRLIFSQEVRASGTTGAAIDVSATYTLGADIHFTDVQIMENIATAGVNSFIIRGADGLYVTNLHMHGTMQINPSGMGNETTMASLAFTNCYFDSATGDTVALVGTAGVAYKNIRFVNSYFRNGLRGLAVEALSVIEHLIVSACRFSGNQRTGLDMRNANIKNSLVSACIFDGNNVANGAGWCDLNINGDTIAVSACTFAGGGAAGAGVAIAAGATNPTLDGINLTNSTAASRVVNASATATFRGIAGWKVKNSGVQTVPIGTSVAITHGLGLTPTRESIRLVPYSNSPTAWVSAVAPTTFTVTLASAAAGAFSLGWFIDMEK